MRYALMLMFIFIFIFMLMYLILRIAAADDTAATLGHPTFSPHHHLEINAPIILVASKDQKDQHGHCSALSQISFILCMLNGQAA
ncbi:hypothetical protein AKJ16_DCAP22049 [Drosera capensis]